MRMNNEKDFTIGSGLVRDRKRLASKCIKPKGHCFSLPPSNVQTKIKLNRLGNQVHFAKWPIFRLGRTRRADFAPMFQILRSSRWPNTVRSQRSTVETWRAKTSETQRDAEWNISPSDRMQKVSQETSLVSFCSMSDLCELFITFV